MHVHKEIKLIVYANQNKGKAFGASARSQTRAYCLEGSYPNDLSMNAHYLTSRKYILSIKLVSGAVGMKPMTNSIKSSLYTIT